MKYQVLIKFEIDEEFMALVPAHRSYINFLINKAIVDSYIVCLEIKQAYLTLNAENKIAAKAILKKSPLYRFWTYDIHEVFVYDGQMYRLPTLQLN